MKKEYILCAAIWFDDEKEHVHQPKNIKTGLVLCGWRHHCIFPQTGGVLNEMPMKAERINKGIKETQGFITNLNRFVDRDEAGEIAFAAGQTDKVYHLTSEHLY